MYQSAVASSVRRLPPNSVSVVPVNDAPLLLGLPDPWTVNVTEEVEMNVVLTLHDEDDDTSSLTVSTNSSRVTWEAETSSLVLLYPEGSASETQ